jgi:hypothetical protein
MKYTWNQKKRKKKKKENWKIRTCHRMDLATLGCRPMVPKNLPGHCSWHKITIFLTLNPIREELTASYRLTGLVWEITSWSSRLTSHFRRIYETYLKSMKKIWKITTCHCLDLETIGSRLVMPKNRPATSSSATTTTNYEFKRLSGHAQILKLSVDLSERTDICHCIS